MALLYISPSSSDDLAYAQWHTFRAAQLCVDGHPAHILRLSDDLEDVIRSLGIRSLAYSTTHPTAVAFHALAIIATAGLPTGKVPDSIFNLGYLVRVIFNLERESVERVGVEGHFLSRTVWYHCLSLCGPTLHVVRDKVASVAWYALGRKMAVYESRLDSSQAGSDRAFEESAEQYTHALHMLAELFKVRSPSLSPSLSYASALRLTKDTLAAGHHRLLPLGRRAHPDERGPPGASPSSFPPSATSG